MRLWERYLPFISQNVGSRQQCVHLGEEMQMKIEQRSHNRGFTLIEVMVVIVILGILAAIVVPRVMDRPDTARLAKVKSDVRTLESALQLYKLDNFSYPTTDQGLEALASKPSGEPEPRNWKDGGYVNPLPRDPWGNNYLYLNPGVHAPVDIYSLGADGQEGGEGPNADLGNWTSSEQQG